MIPDFHSARFIVSAENPFRLTSPSEQALYFIGQNDSTITVNADGTVSTEDRDTTPESKRSQDSEHVLYPNPSYDVIIDAITNAAKQRTKQGTAYLSLVNSELMLVKKSLFISVFAALAALLIGVVCWLLINIAIGGTLYSFSISIVAISVVLLCFNIGLCLLFYRIAKKALHLVSLNRLISLLKRTLVNSNIQ